MNKYYSYPDIDLMDMAFWSRRNSMVWPLGVWLSQENKEYLRREADLSIFNGRSDGAYDFKTRSVTYPDVAAEWEWKGLFFRTGEMAGVCWFAMAPAAVKNREERNPKVLVVIHDADYRNPNYMMNAVEYYRQYHETALQENWVVLYVIPDGGDNFCMFISILQELCSILHILPAKVALDVSAVYRLGKTLRDVPHFRYLDREGRAISVPDKVVEYFGEVPVLDITGRWPNTNSSLVRFISGGAFGHPLFRLEEFIHSAGGRRMAEAASLERDYMRPDDPKLLAKWEQMGLVYASHSMDGDQWLSFVPRQALETGEKVPVVAIFQEVSAVDPFLSVSAFAAYYEWFDIAADGQTALLFFALESADDNDLYAEIIAEAARLYPIDLTRVYLTGHSHNAHFACEFARRHPEKLAAIAPCGMTHGIPEPEYSHEVIKVTDEMVEASARTDLPIVNINGYCENELGFLDTESDDYAHAVRALQRRLKAYRCPVPAEEEIRKARTDANPNPVSRFLGIPAEVTDIRVVYGRECYIADLPNLEGKRHLRLVSIEKMIHVPSPQMASLAWDFMRRFARDPVSGEIIERY